MNTFKGNSTKAVWGIIRLKSIVLTLFFAAFFAIQANAQLATTQGNAANLVQNVLLGPGITVSNITFTGHPNMLGSFTYGGGNPNLGFASGVILSTGNITDAMGANTVANAGVNFNQDGDPNLTNAVGTSTQDAAVLEFDFIPQSDNVAFRYVFASEEYPEFVGSQYNDVFGFFITGPGFPPMGQNIAIVPGTATPVAINNVNQLTNTNLYRDNTGGSSTQFDGFTSVLTTNNVTVTPCSTYHIKIAIADVGDGFYDSAVFLEASSFKSASNNIRAEVSFGTDNGLLYEGCGRANIILSKSFISNSPEVFDIAISGTATNGVDYSQFPTQVTIPAGDSAIAVPLIPTFDGITEPNETVSLTISQVICLDTIYRSVNLTITNVEPLQVTINPAYTEYICPFNPTDLTATVTGGISPYSYNWTNGLVGQTITVYPPQTTTYTVNVVDNCNAQNGQAQAVIALPGYVPLDLVTPPDTVICPGDSILLTVTKRGGRGDSEITFSWANGLGDGPSKWVKPAVTTSYDVTVTDSCGTTVTKTIVVEVLPTNAAFDYFYLENRKIKFLDYSSADVVNWYWDFGDGNQSTNQSPFHTYQDTGLYRVSLIVENINGCLDTAITVVRAYPDYALYIPNAFTPNSDGLNEDFSAIGEGFINYEMYIFNRWGEQIFKTIDYTRRWDGRDKSGIVAPQGVYVYVVKVKTPPGDEYTLRGSVVLIN